MVSVGLCFGCKTNIFPIFSTLLYVSFTLVLGATCVRNYLIDDVMIAEKVLYSPIFRNKAESEYITEPILPD
jgi:hypothetical protein